ncbi:MAG: hypothetical protein R3Y46_08000 [Opitutales bacterium]
MKNLKILIFAIFALCPIFLLAQSDTKIESIENVESVESNTEVQSVESTDAGYSKRDKIKNAAVKFLDNNKNRRSEREAPTKAEKEEVGFVYWMIILLLLACVVLGCFAIVIHIPMVWLLDNKIKFYAKGVDFSKKRKKLGLAESSPEETQKCSSILQEGFADWRSVDGILVPNDSYAYKKAAKAIRQVAKAMPSDAELCSQLRDKSKSFCNMAKRKFTGSWLALCNACLFMILFGFPLFMILGVILYIVASFSPKCIKYFEDYEKDPSMISILLWHSILVGWLAEKDGFSFIASLIYLLIVSIIVGIFISFFAVFKYLRNYVLYN